MLGLENLFNINKDGTKNIKDLEKDIIIDGIIFCLASKIEAVIILTPVIDKVIKNKFIAFLVSSITSILPESINIGIIVDLSGNSKIYPKIPNSIDNFKQKEYIKWILSYFFCP